MRFRTGSAVMLQKLIAFGHPHHQKPKRNRCRLVPKFSDEDENGAAPPTASTSSSSSSGWWTFSLASFDGSNKVKQAERWHFTEPRRESDGEK